MDYKHCKCKNSIVDELVDGNAMLYNETLKTVSSNDSFSDCVSCTPYIVLFAVFLVTSVIIGSFLLFLLVFKMLESSLILILRQQFIKCNFIECNFVQNINGKH